MSKELAMLLGAITPEKLIVDKIIEYAQACKTEHTIKGKISEESKTRLASMCQLLMINLITNGKPEKATEMLQEMDRRDRAGRLLGDFNKQ